MLSSIALAPTPLQFLVPALSLVLSLVLLAAGAPALQWGTGWRRERGKAQRPPLGGGLGGALAGAYAVGTFTALLMALIIAKTSNKDDAVAPVALAAILIVAGVVGTMPCARWETAARIALGFSGGIALSLLLGVTFHLGKTLSRLVLVAIVLPFSLLFALWPAQWAPFAIAVHAATTGSFQLVVAIDVLCYAVSKDLRQSRGFAELLELLVAEQGLASEVSTLPWSSSTGQGLIAVWWILGAAGTGAQIWWTVRGGGRSKEASLAWDEYLGELIKTSPSTTGTFEPHPTAWQKIKRAFGGSRGGSQAAAYFSSPARRGKLSRNDTLGRPANPWSSESPESAAFAKEDDSFDVELAAKKGRRQGSEWDSDDETIYGSTPTLGFGGAGAKVGKGGKRGKEQKYGRVKTSEQPAKYSKDQAALSPSSSDEDDNDDEPDLPSPKEVKFDLERPVLKTLPSKSSGLSGSTVVSLPADLPKGQSAVVEEAEESSDEDEAPTRAGTGAANKGLLSGLGIKNSKAPAKYEPSIRSASSSSASSSAAGSTSKASSTGGKRERAPLVSPTLPSVAEDSAPPAEKALGPPANAVPATPSLLNAIDRVQKAQAEARRLAETTAEEKKDPRRNIERKMSLEKKKEKDEWWSGVIGKAATSEATSSSGAKTTKPTPPLPQKKFSR